MNKLNSEPSSNVDSVPDTINIESDEDYNKRMEELGKKFDLPSPPEVIELDFPPAPEEKNHVL